MLLCLLIVIMSYRRCKVTDFGNIFQILFDFRNIYLNLYFEKNDILNTPF